MVNFTRNPQKEDKEKNPTIWGKRASVGRGAAPHHCQTEYAENILKMFKGETAANSE